MALCSIAVAASVVGALVLVKGLFRMRRFGGCGSRFALAGDGHGFDAGPGCGGRRARGPWRRWGVGRNPWLRALFSRLDTTPGQERFIRTVLEELLETGRKARGEAADARGDVARAVAGEEIDESAMTDALSKIDRARKEMEDAMGAALRRIHSVLDAKQRERLAALLSKGPFGRGGPYRSVEL